MEMIFIEIQQSVYNLNYRGSGEKERKKDSGANNVFLLCLLRN